VNRGEIWWVEHPDAGGRPACVLTRQAAIPVVNAVLVAPAIRTIRGIPTASPSRAPTACPTTAR
jgi:mRNA interferase MazF